MGWVDKHDGLLAIDLNHDGKINSGAELLGSHTLLADGTPAEDGWQALAQYDLNKDQVIDANDAVFKDLKVWVDANSNGLTDATELKSLIDLKIVKLNLVHDGSQTLQNGNILAGNAHYTTADGTVHQLTDAWFKVDAPKTATPKAEAPTPTHCDEPWTEQEKTATSGDVSSTAANSDWYSDTTLQMLVDTRVQGVTTL